LITAGLDNKVKFWNFETKCCYFHTARVCPVRTLGFAPEKEVLRVVILFSDGEIGVWEDLDIEKF